MDLDCVKSPGEWKEDSPDINGYYTTNTPEICSILILSTAHLKPETLKKYEYLDPNNQLSYVLSPFPYGFMCYAYDDPEYIDKDVFECCKVARKLKCEYIRFDCDGHILKGLPTYEHA